MNDWRSEVYDWSKMIDEVACLSVLFIAFRSKSYQPLPQSPTWCVFWEVVCRERGTTYDLDVKGRDLWHLLCVLLLWHSSIWAVEVLDRIQGKIISLI